MDPDKLHNPTLRVLNILETAYKYEGGISFTDLSRQTGISKGTLHPIGMTLAAKDYLQCTDSLFTLGKSCFRLGYAYTRTLRCLDIVKAHMEEIVDACNEICQLGILEGTDVLYIAKMEPQQAICVNSSVGATLGAYATSLGKSLLSCYSDDEVRRICPATFIQYTPKTVKNIDELLAQLDTIRTQGYALENGEVNKDIECISVPVQVARQTMAISVSLPIYRSTQEKQAEILALLQQHKHEIADQTAGLQQDLSFI